MGIPKPDPEGGYEDTTVEISRPNFRVLDTALVLRVIAGRDMLKFLPLCPGRRSVIGRDESADLTLTDVSVSRRHASAELDQQGRVILEDLGSVNSLLVHGQPTPRVILLPGDVVYLGQVPLRLEEVSREEISYLRSIAQKLETANRDPLTGLLTRVAMEESLEQMLLVARRKKKPVSAIFMDIDHFKSVNDTYGHAFGDDALVVVARIAMLAVRDGDLCLRYGGEELLIFVMASETAAGVVATRIQQTLHGYSWDRPGLRVTASFGVAEWQTGESVKDWLERSDQALYRAKKNGRDRVEFARNG